jgi:hypothetical protein
MRKRLNPHPPFPFVWVPPETRIRPHRRYRLRPLVWVIIFGLLLSWWFWPDTPEREGPDLTGVEDYLPY